MSARDPLLIVGGYGYENAGDEAILAGLLARHARRRVTVLSRRPWRTAQLHGVRAVGLSGSLAALLSHRTVLIGGGGLFGQHMGRIGRLLPWYGLLAAALGRSVLLDGVGVDGATPRSVRIPLRALMGRAERIVVRDRASRAVLRSWGIDARVEPDRSADMPAAPACAGAALLDAAGVDVSRPVVGLALTGVDVRTRDAVVAAAAETIDALPDVQFCFLPMSRHPFLAEHNDLELALRIHGLRPELRIAARASHPSTLLAAFGLLSAAVCMRYHALLFAERMGVPILPVVYAPKSAAWAAERGIRPLPPTSVAWTQALLAVLGGRRAAAATGAS